MEVEVVDREDKKSSGVCSGVRGGYFIKEKNVT